MQSRPSSPNRFDSYPLFSDCSKKILQYWASSAQWSVQDIAGFYCENPVPLEGGAGSAVTAQCVMGVTSWLLQVPLTVHPQLGLLLHHIAKIVFVRVSLAQPACTVAFSEYLADTFHCFLSPQLYGMIGNT